MSGSHTAALRRRLSDVAKEQAERRRWVRRAGEILSPKQREQRAVRKGLAQRFLKGDGLEIGALHLPLWLPDGARARYVDRYSREDLRREYPELRTHDLVEVDVVDDGETLATVADESADFVIANHFIEHTENPIRTLGRHAQVLKPGGVLYMAVPDKRFTFDRDRPVTPLEHMVADHANGAHHSRRVHYEEWARLVEHAPRAPGRRPRRGTRRALRTRSTSTSSRPPRSWTSCTTAAPKRASRSSSRRSCRPPTSS